MGHTKLILAPLSLGLNNTKATHMKLGHPLVYNANPVVTQVMAFSITSMKIHWHVGGWVMISGPRMS